MRYCDWISGQKALVNSEHTCRGEESQPRIPRFERTTASFVARSTIDGVLWAPK
jgi:hypothetical protein